MSRPPVGRYFTTEILLAVGVNARDFHAASKESPRPSSRNPDIEVLMRGRGQKFRPLRIRAGKPGY